MKNPDLILSLLNRLNRKEITQDDALAELMTQTDLGFARPDHLRAQLQGHGEVIFGECKSAEQISAITADLMSHGQERVLVTRLSKAKAAALVSTGVHLTYDAISRTAYTGSLPDPEDEHTIAILTAGTGDVPVAEEAALTAQFYGNRVERLYDVGVSGLHRLLSQVSRLRTARVIIVAAGMEGALASVTGGLVAVPVIAVPTSVGYGASFGGLAALLSMLSSCAAGVCTVNIDNGFGAAVLADRINHPRN